MRFAFWKRPKAPGAGAIFGTREELNGRRCTGGTHLWVTSSVMGEDCFCLRCWNEIGMVGFFLHGDPVNREVREMVLEGFLYVPDKPTMGHGMTPGWSKERENFLPAVQGRVVTVRAYLAEQDRKDQTR